MPDSFDVFLSYPRASKEHVIPIRDALEAAGVVVWFDEERIGSFESITKNIEKGLARSRVLLAFYDEVYPSRRACQWEFMVAVIAAERLGIPTDRVLVVNPVGSPEHIEPVQFRDALYEGAPAPGDPEALRELVAKVQAHLQEIGGLLGDVAPLIQQRWLGEKQQGVSSNRFVGRMREMWELHSALSSSQAVSVTGSRVDAAQVQGLGGNGKSLMVEEYALRFGPAYPGGVVWLRAYGNDDAKKEMSAAQRNAERERQLRDVLVSFAVRADAPLAERIAITRQLQELPIKQVVAFLGEEIERRGDPCLWVVDDVPSGLTNEQLQAWLGPHPLAKTVITTRSRQYSSLGRQVDLGVLDAESAYQLLCSHRSPTSEVEEAAARGILADVGFHALAVDVAGAALRESAGVESFGEFRESLAKNDKDALELAAELGGSLPNREDEGKSIAAVLLRSIERLTEEGRDVLRVASVLAPAPIPVALIEHVLKQVDDLEEAVAKERTKRALSDVGRYSLMDAVGEYFRSVHTLVSRAVRFRDEQRDRVTRMRDAARVALRNAFATSATDPAEWSFLEVHVPHARELVGEVTSEVEADLLGWVARFEMERGAYAVARGDYETQLEALRELLGERHPETLTSMNNLAGTLRAMGELKEARTLQKQVLAARKEVLGERHPETLTSMNNLASTLYAMGELKEARTLQEEVLAARKEVWGERHPETLTSMNNLASTLYAMGELKAARTLEEEVLTARKEVWGERHPETLTSMNNLAGTLYAMGELKAARTLEEEVLTARKEVLGERHPETLTSMNNLAGTLRAMGELSEARTLQKQVLAARKEVLGERHPETLTSMNNLAETLRAMGELKAARTLHEEVLAARKEVLGEHHPHTLASMNNLAETLRAMGELKEARTLHEDVLTARKEVLGERHPSTTISAWNLFVTLDQEGDREGAQRVLTEDLVWLLRVDPESLGADQRQIQQMLAQMVRQ